MRKQFKLIYDTTNFIDGFECDTLSEAQDGCRYVLEGWMESCDPDPDEWDYMIETCSVWVEQYVPDADDWSTVWEPSDAWLEAIGWTERGEQ